MLGTRYKQHTYYVVKTEDKFLREIANEIFTDTYIIEVKQVSTDKTKLIIKGSKDFRLYEAEVKYLQENATVENVINAILN